MPRTTIDIDAAILRKLKRRQRHERHTLGQIVSELLAVALASPPTKSSSALRWISRPMGMRVDLEDKEALRRALEEK